MCRDEISNLNDSITSQIVGQSLVNNLDHKLSPQEIHSMIERENQKQLRRKLDQALRNELGPLATSGLTSLLDKPSDDLLKVVSSEAVEQAYNRNLLVKSHYNSQSEELKLKQLKGRKWLQRKRQEREDKLKH